jgi:hypothetical protein
LGCQAPVCKPVVAIVSFREPEEFFKKSTYQSFDTPG